MSISDLLGIIGVILAIASLVFAMWTWMKAEAKKHELLVSLDTIHAIAEKALLDANLSASGNAGETLGAMKSIHAATAKYSETNTPHTELLSLIHEGALWSDWMISNFEVSPGITEVWLVTPDLKPDSSDEATGRIVHKNIMGGKKYVFFYPSDLPRKESEISRLKENIFLANPTNTERLLSGLTLVPLSRNDHKNLFYRGNIILYFRDKNRVFPPRCFEEVVLTKFSDRGIFWQEHPEPIANEIRHELDIELPRG